jgi:hypothetical protein
MTTLESLERRAAERGLLLRLQVGRPLGLLYGLRVAVARQPPAGGQLRLVGELKGWAWPTPGGLRLDTLQVAGRSSGLPDLGVGPLVAAAAFAWALEQTPSRRAQILAIRDDDGQHRRLVRYFRRLGFVPSRELGAALWDLPERLVWGGAGLVMQADCSVVLERAVALLDQNWS